MWRIYGQDHLIRQLSVALRINQLGHSYLLIGPPSVGKMTLALNLAQAVNCLARKENPEPLAPVDAEVVIIEPANDGQFSLGQTNNGNTSADAIDGPCGQCSQCCRIAQKIHPDIKIVGLGDGDEDGSGRRDIRIGQVRELESFLGLTSYEGFCKVVIIDGAESLNTAAANALLKTLEEPPGGSLLILLSANEEALLSTIRSRCATLYLKPMAKEELTTRLTDSYGLAPELAEQLARWSRGCPGWAINAIQDQQALEQREADLERLREVCAGGLDTKFDYAAELASRFNRDREREKLYLWLRWWRDLLLVKEGSEKYLYNSHRGTELRLQAAQLTTAQIVTFIQRLNQTLEALDDNVNPRLALETLLLALPTTA